MAACFSVISFKYIRLKFFNGLSYIFKNLQQPQPPIIQTGFPSLTNAPNRSIILLMKKIIIITGHYGSGKTNLSVNLALKLAGEGERVTVVDLDLVNPYFRTADFGQLFAEKGIELIYPDYANTNLDIPSVSFDLERIAAESGRIIIDVGGDDAGAVALGRYAEALSAFDVDMFYVINALRYMTRTPEEAIELLRAIEAASHMKHTGIVSNTNLGAETTPEIVGESLDFADRVAGESALPLVYVTLDEAFDIPLQLANAPLLRTRVYVRPLWERNE